MNGVLVSIIGIAALTLLTALGNADANITVPVIAGLAGYTGGYAAGTKKKVV